MRFDTLQAWLDWQASLHPTEIELGLERVDAVWQRLHPAPFEPIVLTIGGTNGKGSCVAMADAILRAAGYRVGCYTSPHLLRYNERVCIDGEQVSDEALCEAFEAVEQARRDTPLTYFEFGTLAALWLFARARPEVVLLEVGLGGRLDATNLLDADAALVTTVDLDHQQWLGDDREQIGFEKAGIYRAGRPAIYGGAQPPASLVEHAARIGAELQVAGRDYQYRLVEGGWSGSWPTRRRNALPLPALRGAHQLVNAAATLALLESVSDRLALDQTAVREGLQAASIDGRFQVWPGTPRVVLDVAHNRQGLASVRANLAELGRPGKVRCVLGMLADKSVEDAVRAIGDQVDGWFLASPDAARALPVEALVSRVGRLSGDTPVAACASVGDALRQALAVSEADDTVLVCGSFYTVAEALVELDS